MNFDDKVVLITGAGQGIGRAFALRFAECGASVVVADLNDAAAHSVAAEISAKGQRAVAISVDVSKRESTLDMAQRAIDAYGTIDVLINNAAIFSTLQLKGFDEL